MNDPNTIVEAIEGLSKTIYTMCPIRSFWDLSSMGIGKAYEGDKKQMIPRPYQTEALDGIRTQLNDNNSTLLVMATGTGKTQVFSMLAREFMKWGRIMVLAHRGELIYQAHTHLKDITSCEPDIEMADFHATTYGFSKPRIVCSTIQTQIAGRNGNCRMKKFDPNEFSLLVLDECFVPGTMIDGRPVYSIQKGDQIRSVDHNTGSIEYKTVKTTMCRRTNKLVEIKLRNGKNIICTPNHPVFTLHGYVAAGTLHKYDMMLATIPIRKESNGKVSNLWKTYYQQQKNMLRKMQKQGFFGNNVTDESQVCVRANETEQSDETARSQGESVTETEGDGLEAETAGRQRQAASSATATLSLCSWLADRGCNQDDDDAWQWLSNMLRGGYWKPSLKDSNKSGRKQPHGLVEEGARQEEGRIFEWIGVESIEIYKQGSSKRFEQLCPEGLVYNLEVEDNHNYFAEDILVHNCHHAPSQFYKRVIEYYRQNKDLKVLGVTATPDRADEKALGQIFETVAYEYGISEGINDGWLVPINQRVVMVEDLDFSQCRTTAGDLNGRDLATIMEFEEILHQIATPTVELSGDRKSLIFASSLIHAERLTEIINRHRPSEARWVHGGTPKDERADMFREYAEGKFRYLSNVGVATEGFDEPGIGMVVMGRPTKSRSLYAQMVGRGTRTLPGTIDGIGDSVARRSAIALSKKATLEILDFVGNSGRHRLISTSDLLGGDYNDDVIERARKNIEKKGEGNVLTELQQAEKELEAEAVSKSEAIRRDRIKARAHYSTAKINPFNVFDIEPQRVKGWNEGRKPSRKQLDMLERVGVDCAGLGFTHASQLIQRIINNRKEKKCTYKQARCLSKYHYNPKDMDFGEASNLITKIAENGWRRPV